MKISRALGLETDTIRSTSHEWNIVKIDGKWYEVDGQAPGFFIRTLWLENG